MSANGGSVLGASIRGRECSATADATFNMKLGGKENEVRANGDGTARIIQVTTPWGITGVVLSCDLLRGDLEFFQEIADSGEQVDITVTFVGNVTVQAVGTIVGEVMYDSTNASASVAFGGGDKLTRQ